jgi:hypothetical protein
MPAIDVGPGAANYVDSVESGYTCIDLENPANHRGKITTISLWFATNGSDVKAGTFYGTSPDMTSRDSETIGSVTAGSKQDFSGLDCTVEEGDYVGVYWSSGYIERATSGHSGFLYKAGDQFGAGEQTYTAASADDCIGIYGTGTTVGMRNFAAFIG